MVPCNIQFAGIGREVRQPDDRIVVAEFVSSCGRPDAKYPAGGAGPWLQTSGLSFRHRRVIEIPASSMDSNRTAKKSNLRQRLGTAPAAPSLLPSPAQVEQQDNHNHALYSFDIGKTGGFPVNAIRNLCHSHINFRCGA